VHSDDPVANHAYIHTLAVTITFLISFVILSDHLCARWLRESLTHDPSQTLNSKRKLKGRGRGTGNDLPRTVKIVQFLVYGSTRHFTLLIDGRNLSCELTPFLQQCRTFLFFLRKKKNPCCEPTPLYTVYCPFDSLAASLRRFMPVCGLQAKRSSGK
jgi:hypothetical protein